MISGIGIDIVDISRFKLFAEDKIFLAKYFSQSEVQLGVESMAGRFAAKEAFLKAVKNRYLLNWDDIEIIKKPDGSPDFKLKNTAAKFVENRYIHLSISHSSDLAIALVIIESKM